MNYSYQNINVFFEVNGDSDNYPIVLCHPLFGSGYFFKELVEELEADYYVIRPDFPGFGKSDSLMDRQHTIAEYVQVIAGILEQLKIKQVHMLGASMGAAIALAFAAEKPEKVNKLILNAPPWRYSALNMKLYRRMLSYISEQERLVNMVAGIDKELGTKLILKTMKRLGRNIYNYEKRNNLVSVSIKNLDLKATAEIWQDIKIQDFTDEAKAITQQTLLLAGELDETVHPLEVAKLTMLMTNSYFKLMPDATHSALFENPKLAGRIVRDFLS